MSLANEILGVEDGQTLVVADAEHFSMELLDHVSAHTPFELLVPMRDTKRFQHQVESMPGRAFTRHWVGYATAKQQYSPRRSQGGTYWQFIQRQGERDFTYKGFVSTTDSDAAQALSQQFPKRWHVEEFLNRDQALGWQRAGTQNLHIRYGQMTMALIAQTLINELRRRLGEPYQQWDARHLANDLFSGLDGDVRVRDETILVTFYNLPEVERFRQHYEDLPGRLEAEGIDPRIPWLYNFKLDFRFR